jgi:hypothetical protein
VYGFPWEFDAPPTEAILAKIKITNAIYLDVASDLGAWDQTWHRIGRLPAFRIEDWPVPPMAQLNGNVPWPGRYEEIGVCIKAQGDGEAPPSAMFWDTDSKVIIYDDYRQLPRYKGLGDGAWIQVTLPMAIRDKFWLHYYRVTPARLALWSRVTNRILESSDPAYTLTIRRQFGEVAPRWHADALKVTSAAIPRTNKRTLASQYPGRCATGDVFAIPLIEHGWGIALVARQWRVFTRPPCRVFLYCFPWYFEQPPDAEVLHKVKITNAVHVHQASDLGAWDGTWRRIGTLPDFRCEDWPVPPMTVGKSDAKKPDRERAVLITGQRDGDLPSQELFLDTAGMLVSESEYRMLPPARTTADTAWTSQVMEWTIRDTLDGVFSRITLKRLAMWKRVMQRLHSRSIAF